MSNDDEINELLAEIDLDDDAPDSVSPLGTVQTIFYSQIHFLRIPN